MDLKKLKAVTIEMYNVTCRKYYFDVKTCPIYYTLQLSVRILATETYNLEINKSSLIESIISS